jgi:hypothetical protein
MCSRTLASWPTSPILIQLISILTLREAQSTASSACVLKALSSDFDSLSAQRVNGVYQVCQEGVHAEMVYSESVMQQKLDYIHQNPVKRGYVDFGEQWRYSSARDYQGELGLIEVRRWC